MALKDTVAEVKNAYAIEDYMQSVGVDLKPFSANKYRGLCPFHNEKTPSFTVDVEFQNYYCFGCKVNGDLITYVSESENMSFFETLKMLADDRGISIGELGDGESAIDYKSLKAIHKDAANFFCKNFRKLDRDHAAWREILDRGLSLKGMKYGYALDNRYALYKHLSERGYGDDLILQSGVCKQSKSGGKIFDFWSGRLMFIIVDIQGAPIGFSGRKLFEDDKMGKYVNSSDSPIFDKSRALFNVADAKKVAGEKKEMYVVEGQFDVAAFRESGIENVVAASGTAFTKDHAKTCKRLVGPGGKIIFVFDSDQAGQDAIRKVFDNGPEIHAAAYTSSLPDESDPSDYRRDHGSEALRSYVETHREPLFGYVLRKVTESYDLSSTTDRANYVEEASEVAASVRNRTIYENMVKEISLNSMSSIDTVRDAAESARKGKKKKRRVKDREKVDDRPEFDSDEAEEETIDLIENDRLHRVSAMFITFGLTRPDFRKAVIRVRGIIPDGFQEFLTELERDVDGRLMAEKFTQSKLFTELTRFEKLHHFSLMSRSDKVQHFKFLKSMVDKENKTRKQDAVRQRILSILGEGDGAGVDQLEKALAKEKKELGK